MKITLLFSVVFMQLAFAGHGQTVSIHVQKAPVRQIIYQLSTQSGYDFIYDAKLMENLPPVSINAKNRPLKEVLELCFADQPFEFVFNENKTIIIKRRPVTTDPVSKQEPINGTVRDTSGRPLAGVSVVIRGTSRGTATDNNGFFQLQANRGDVLVFSNIGYTTQEVELVGQSAIQVTFVPRFSDLNEVVVVGYGTQRKGTLVSAVSTVSSDRLSQSPLPNVSNMIAGRVSGVTAIQPQGTPGSDATNIYVRGIATTGNVSPLYVIDGIPRTATDFNRLAATEIESVSVLKDAAAAAVYGARGANGVILITTKRGKEGRLSLNYSFNYGIQQATRLPDYVSSAQYATMYNTALVNENRPELYTSEAIQKYRDGSDPIFYPNTDWLSILRGNVPQQQHNLAAVGGTDKVNYYLSFNYLDQENLLNASGNSDFGFQRYNFRSNVDVKATNTTRIAFDVSGYLGIAKNPGQTYDYIFENINRAPSVYAGKYSNGLWGPAANNRNGWAAAYGSGYRRNDSNGLLSRLEVSQEIGFITGLSVKGIGAFDYKPQETKTWLVPVPTYIAVQDGDAIRYDQLTGKDNPSLVQYSGVSRNSLLEFHALYDRSFGSHSFNALLLYSQQEERFADMSVTRKDYLSDELEIINAGGTTNQETAGDATQYRRQSVVGRLNYNYGQRYLFEFSFRYDGSTLFAKGQRFGFFPAASVGWVASSEKFLQHSEAINYLKLRASYGELGNDQIGSYQYLSFYGFGPGTAMGTAGSFQNNISLTRMANPNVTWETSQKTDIGLEATLFDDFNIEADYFIEQRRDILGRRSATIPATLGTPASILPYENFQRVNNRGFELTVGYRKQVGADVNVQTQFSISHAKNKVIDIGEPTTKAARILQAGRPLNPVYGYVTEGYFQSDEEIKQMHGENYPFLQPGDIRYKDLNEDGFINGDDVTYIGNNNLPINIFGWQSTVTFKAFEFSMFWQAGTGNEQYFNNWMAKPFNGAGNALKRHADYWTPENRDAAYPRILTSSSWNYDNVSDFWLYDMSYLRLKNLQIAYQLPEHIVSKIKAQYVRLYVNGANLLTFSKFTEVDPENTNNLGHYYPQQVVFNGGIQVAF